MPTPMRFTAPSPPYSSSSSTSHVSKWLALSPSRGQSWTSEGGTKYLTAPGSSAYDQASDYGEVSSKVSSPAQDDKGKRPMDLGPALAAAVAPAPTKAGTKRRLTKAERIARGPVLKKDGTPWKTPGPRPGSVYNMDGSLRLSGPAARGVKVNKDGTPRRRSGPNGKAWNSGINFKAEGERRGRKTGPKPASGGLNQDGSVRKKPGRRSGKLPPSHLQIRSPP